MIIKNIKIFNKNKYFEPGELIIKNGIIVPDTPKNAAEEEIIDGGGCYAIPGLIDMHFHGCMGYDFSDGNMEAIRKIAEYEAGAGITGIAPAVMTLPVDKLEQILSVAAKYKSCDKNNSCKTADILGINMEGPFISKIKKGAQNEKYIIPCDSKLCRHFIDVSEGLVKIIGIAPDENKNYIQFINDMKDRVNVALAHTNADYDTALTAFKTGANHVVHMYNAMSPFNHRIPGVAGAAFDSSNVTAELICDGVHLHPSVVRATLKLLGEDRVIFISDSMRATGMSDGIYDLGGQEVKVTGNKATLVSDNSIAGSVTNLMDCVRTAVKEMDIPLETAVACATINPARKLGVDDKYGSLDVGKIGNVVWLDERLEVKKVIMGNKTVL